MAPRNEFVGHSGSAFSAAYGIAVIRLKRVSAAERSDNVRLDR